MAGNYFFTDAGIKTFAWITSKDGSTFREEVDSFFSKKGMSLEELKNRIYKTGLEKKLFEEIIFFSDNEINWFMVGVKVALLSNIANNAVDFDEKLFERAMYQCNLAFEEAGIDDKYMKILNAVISELYFTQSTDRKNEIIEEINQLLISVSDDSSKRKRFSSGGLMHVGRVEFKKKEVFFSYSSSNYDVVNQIEPELNKINYTIKQYKRDINYKDSIEEFAKKIGYASYVVIILSKEYFESVYCMNELVQIWRKSNSEKDQFLQKIFPIVKEGFDIENINAHFESWRIKYSEKEEWIKKSIALVTEEEFGTYCRIREIARVAPGIGTIMAGVNILSTDKLLKNEFKDLIAAIQNS